MSYFPFLDFDNVPDVNSDLEDKDIVAGTEKFKIPDLQSHIQLSEEDVFGPGSINRSHIEQINMINQFNASRAMQSNPQKFFCFREDKIIRIYIAHDISWSKCDFQNIFMSNLLKLKSDEECHFYLGTGSGASGLVDMYNLGPMLHAVETCRGKVVTHADGMCSSEESILWAYGHERHRSEFSVIVVEGCRGITDAMPSYTQYFRVLYQRFVELGFISQEELEDLLTSQKIFSFIGHSTEKV
jgi:hypothetical protein